VTLTRQRPSHLDHSAVERFVTLAPLRDGAGAGV